MKLLYRFAVTAYLIAAVLICFPMMDVILAIWPVQMREVGWRFATENLLSRNLLTPLLGLTFAFGAALILEQPKVMRVLAILKWLGVLILAGGVVLYGLDAIQMRAQIRPEDMTRFYLGTLVALAKFGIGSLALFLLGFVEWRTASSLTKATKQAKADPKASIVEPGSRRSSSSGGKTAAK